MSRTHGDDAENAGGPATRGHRGNRVDCRQCGLYRVCTIAGLPGGTPAVMRHRRPLHAGAALTPGPAPSVVALRSGALKRVPLAEPGEGAVTGFVLPGEVVTTAGRAEEGWVALSTAYCCTLSREAIAALCRRAPQHGPPLMAALMAPLGADGRRLNRMLRGRTERRLAVFLLDMRARQDRGDNPPASVHLPMTRRDLAAYLDLNLSTVSRTLTRLERLGVLQRSGQWIELLDVPALDALCGGD